MKSSHEIEFVEFVTITYTFMDESEVHPGIHVLVDHEDRYLEIPNQVTTSSPSIPSSIEIPLLTESDITENSGSIKPVSAGGSSDINFKYVDESDSLIIKDGDITKVFKLDKYGPLFKYILKSIDSLDGE